MKRVTLLGMSTLLVLGATCPRFDDSPERATFHTLRSIRRAAHQFRSDSGIYPESLDQMCAYRWGCGSDAAGRNADGWGTRIVYERIGQNDYRLRSAGPDRIMGTEDDIVFQASVEAKRIASVAGCYDVDLDWWPEFGGHKLVLDTTALSARGFYRVSPLPENHDYSGNWYVDGDTVIVEWPIPYRPSSYLKFTHQEGDLLIGIAMPRAYPARPVTARRSDCERGEWD